MENARLDQSPVRDTMEPLPIVHHRVATVSTQEVAVLEIVVDYIQI